MLAGVPDSRLPQHPLVTTEPLQRLRHARGQSFPDWLAVRYGRVPAYPDGIAHVTNDDEVRQIQEDVRRLQVLQSDIKHEHNRLRSLQQRARMAGSG